MFMIVSILIEVLNLGYFKVTPGGKENYNEPFKKQLYLIKHHY